jgi:CheY-like chemotaxis protein
MEQTFSIFPPFLFSPGVILESMEANAQSQSISLDGLNLLVVEDDDDTRELLKVLLQTNGAHVTAVSSVPEALVAYDSSRPDVLIADIGMPEYNGYTLIGRVRARDRAESARMVPAIALTAYATAIDRDTVLSAGFQVHVPKPFEPNALVALVADLASRYH